ncbi:MAG: TauD/TfdA family dioxygenase [Alphaproteobacteria bacterium]|nr:TauD/TfdA family dioxygenase [Alphaproteobacteria bacterium]MCB9930610.1 TauD/TfdA family dioxygenase [Alphaproteobacteria bacterium]
MGVMTKPQAKQSFTVTPIKPKIGAEITGIDLTRPVDENTRQALYDAVVDNIAVVIKNQKLTPAQFAAAAELFGELMEDQIKTNLVQDVPMVSILDNFEKDSKGNQAKVPKNATWHTDHTNKERPPKFTFLYAEMIPSKGGGTSVANMNAAYEALTPERRAELDRLQSANQRISSARLAVANPDSLADQQRLAEPLMVHPLVRTHPDRGTKAIWFHQGKTETLTGMDPFQTQDYLTALLAEIIQDDITYTHNWSIGDLLIVDNRSALHKAGSDYDMSERRKLYRTMVQGDRPV